MHDDIRAAVEHIRSATEAADRIGVKFEKLADNANATVTDVKGVVSKAVRRQSTSASESQ